MQGLADGQVLEVRASAPEFTKDVAEWCRRSAKHHFYNQKEGSEYVAKIATYKAPMKKYLKRMSCAPDLF